MLLLQMVVAACSNQMEPARRSLGEIQAALGAASTDAATYVPDRLTAVQGQLAALEAAFDGRDYGAVVSGAPAVLRAAQDLMGEAAAAKTERRRALADGWAQLAAVVPGRIEALQHRIEFLSARRSGGRSVAVGGAKSGIDLEAARSDLGAAESLWSKAQAAFAGGNLVEAGATARTVASTIDALAGALQAEPPTAAPHGAPDQEPAAR